MPKSLLEQLPKIVADGKTQAERILEGLEGRHRVGLQTREWVLPSKDTNASDWIAAASRQAHLGTEGTAEWTNRLVYGDNLLAMAALLAGDEHTPSLRGKVDLIYIDPPFDSKADYRTKVTLPGVELEQRPTVIEQFAYSDTWSDGTASYLAMITPRLVLMRELLTTTGSFYLHVDARLSHYVKVVLDEIFGKQNFVVQIVWNRSKSKLKATSNKWLAVDDHILMYGKGDKRKFNIVYWPYTEEYKKRFNLTDKHGAYYWAPIGTYSQGRLQRLLDQGRVKLPLVTGVMPRIKNYLHEGKGVPPDNLWVDIDAINSQAKEDTGYDTQKPFKLLTRILESFEPFDDEGWRLLLLRPVIDHVVKVFALALARAEDHAIVGHTEVRHRLLSEVTKLMVRESASLEVGKCIYERLPYPTRSGGLERDFIEWAQRDAGIEAFCKISENRHDFVRLRYVKDDGLPAFYSPDFLVRTADAVYLVETKAQQQTTHPNVQRKLRAAATWCERINALAPQQRADRPWHYALVGESLFRDWLGNNARMSELLSLSRVRATPAANAQGGLALGD